MRGTHLRLLVVGGALLATVACATRQEWAEWNAHGAHFASREHLVFSMKNQDRREPPLVATPAEVALAREDGWWGGPFEVPPPADVAGRWVGTWSGYGVFNWPRTATARAEFTQFGGLGDGRLMLGDTLAADVPEVVTDAGQRGVRVVLRVSGSTLLVRHELDGRHLTGVFTVEGDRMVGRLENTRTTLVLTRQR